MIRITARSFTILCMLATLGLAVPFLIKQVSEWDICFVPTARHLLAGEDIYDPPHGYVYPPLQSLFAVPVAAQPHWLQRLAWFAVNAAALWIALASAWRLAGGPDLERTLASRREQIACGLGLCFGLTYFLNSLMHQQTDILLAALLFAGIEQILRGRGLQAAMLFGLAAAMKCTPLLFAPYLLLRGRFLAAVWLVFVAIAVSMLPDLIHSPAGYGTWLEKWWTLYIAPMAGAGHRPGIWASEIIYNQSLIGSLNRWTMSAWTLDGSVQIHLIEPLLSSRSLRFLYLASGVLLGSLSLLAMRFSRKLPDDQRTAWDCSLVLAGMLLFSPMSSAAHFGNLLLPAFLLARSALIQNSRTAIVPLAGMLLAAFASNQDLLGKTFYTLGLWHGSVLAGAIFALSGSWLEMSRRISSGMLQVHGWRMRLTNRNETADSVGPNLPVKMQ